GVETDTLDRTGNVVAMRACDAITREQIVAALATMVGEQDQVPPMYSAIKQGGVRMYHRARAGEDVERAPRKIRIDQLELLAFEPPRFRIAIACSKGTYVRTIVADLGTALGCGAHLAELRRTRSGRFAIEQAVTLDALQTLDADAVRRRLIPLHAATGLPSVVVPGELLARVRAGLQLPIERLTTEAHERFQLVDEQGRLVAIVHPEAGRVIYDRVFPEYTTS
ncbi:MAG TPA: hypothetical protein VFQ53_13835, partial [Kofleriaceae bacterium]|nr:hypothetical protein [Kofleriaceae bacterium]